MLVTCLCFSVVSGSCINVASVSVTVVFVKCDVSPTTINQCDCQVNGVTVVLTMSQKILFLNMLTHSPHFDQFTRDPAKVVPSM